MSGSSLLGSSWPQDGRRFGAIRTCKTFGVACAVALWFQTCFQRFQMVSRYFKFQQMFGFQNPCRILSPSTSLLESGNSKANWTVGEKFHRSATFFAAPELLYLADSWCINASSMVVNTRKALGFLLLKSNPKLPPDLVRAKNLFGKLCSSTPWSTEASSF